MAKHSEKRGGRKVIRLEDHLPQHQATPAQEPPHQEEASPEEAPQATIEYGEEEAAGEEQKKARQVPKALYRVAVVLLVLVLGLAIWVNRGNLTPQNIWNWIQVQITGTGEGDGYPVAITGSSVSEGNFLSAEGNAVALSDTALTILGPSGQELFSQRHSYNQPILKAASGQYLLYNQNSTGYMVVSGTQLHLESSTEQDILAGAIAPNGRFALATQGADGATDVTVYLATGEEQFTYSFAQDYVTALALNADGTWAMVCSVRAQGGQLVSKVTVFDLNSPTPAAEFESQDNLLLAAYWGENGMLYAVGDSALLRARSGELSFSEYGYQGRTPTAFQFNGGSATCPFPPMSTPAPARCWCSGAWRSRCRPRPRSASCHCPCPAGRWVRCWTSSWCSLTPPPARSWPAPRRAATPRASPSPAKAPPMCWASAKSAASRCGEASFPK